MVSKEYSEAAVEVLDMLKYVNSENVKKIPTKVIKFLEDNKSKDYICNLDHTKTVEEMELKPKTEAILGFIYLRYWADEEGKKKFEQKIKENEELFLRELKKEFNDNDIFNNKQNIEQNLQTENVESLPEENKLLQEYKEASFVSKLLNKIKEIFRR